MINNCTMQSFSKPEPPSQAPPPQADGCGPGCASLAGCCFATGIKEADNSLRFMGPIVPHVYSSHMFPLPSPPGNTTSQGLWELKKTLAGTHPRGAAIPRAWLEAGNEGRPRLSPGAGCVGHIFSNCFLGSSHTKPAHSAWLPSQLH